VKHFSASDHPMMLTACQLIHIRKWRRIAASLPHGDVLIVIGNGKASVMAPMQTISAALARRGRRTHLLTLNVSSP
jgi:hypothetical protein